jgi:mRNA-degrading endonuclease toxin of MazEF toxin-antitoxin module
MPNNNETNQESNNTTGGSTQQNTQYSQLENLSEADKTQLTNEFGNKVQDVKKISLTKAIKLIRNIPIICRLHYQALEYRKKRLSDKDKKHPLQPIRGEIYNAIITENVGSEINGNHLVVVMSNPNTNIYADKVNVLPIEGDGNIVPKYLVKLTNNDLEYGHLDKDPSRIIIPEMLTIDKARLERRIGKIKPEKMITVNNKLKGQLCL